MKTYYGNRCQLGGTISIREGGATQSLKHIVRHSPTGMEWGYGGSGPSDTALSIMMDYFGGWPKGSRRATKNYMDFKWAFIAEAPSEGFEITTKQIDAWMEGRDGD